MAREIKPGDALDYAKKYFRGGAMQPNEENAFLSGWADHCKQLQEAAEEKPAVAQDTGAGYAGYTTGDDPNEVDDTPEDDSEKASRRSRRFGRN
jgi:hypothetical protein